MQNITVNLLPEEFLVEKRLKQKKALFLRISAIFFVTGLIITSSVLLLRLAQNQTFQTAQTQLEQERNQVSSMQENESALFILKNRLDLINKLNNTESIPVNAYNLISGIIPTGANILGFTMTKDNEISLTVETSNTVILDQLFNSLLDPKSNKGYITAVKLENIRLQQDKVIVDMALGYDAKASAPAPPKT
jgi:hypothetical protein